jgi:hypothetical protein
MHIHWRGDKLAGLYDVKDFKTDVLYKSFILQPIKLKQVVYWDFIIKLYVVFTKVYFPVIVE